MKNSYCFSTFSAFSENFHENNNKHYMKKNKRKTKDFYTIDPDLFERFVQIIESEQLNKSKVIEKLISSWVGGKCV